MHQMILIGLLELGALLQTIPALAVRQVEPITLIRKPLELALTK